MSDANPPAIDREAFGALADVLIPSAPGHLSASEAGIAGPLLDKVAALVPERLDQIRAVIATSAGQTPAACLDALRRDDPETYDAFCETIAAAYFMAPAIREHVRFPGRVPVAARADAADLADLLLPVLEADFAPRGMDL